MVKHWSLAEEIYRAFHRWPQMLLFCLVGGLVGWLAAFLWPATYRATADIDVALNPYRAFEDTNFLALSRPEYSNLDDYKSWQMSQLMAAIFQDEFIQETLSRLQLQDPEWQSVDRQELRQMLDTNWRSAGKWSLVADSPKPGLVEQAVQTWRDVILERVSLAVQASRRTIFTDEALQAVIRKQVDGKARLSELQASQAESATQSEIAALQASLQELASEQSRLEELFNDQSRQSLGLSPNLEIAILDQVSGDIVRPQSLLILAGGILGFLTWLLIALVKISQRDKQVE